MASKPFQTSSQPEIAPGQPVETLQLEQVSRELARRRLPPGVSDRPKRGFAVPISDWFRTDFGALRTLLLDHLNSDRPFGPLHDRTDINVAFVHRLLDEHWAAGGLAPLRSARVFSEARSEPAPGSL